LYGFTEYQTFEGKKAVTCDVCYMEQEITRDKGADEGFYEMVKAGTIRLCPMCDHPHMKDKGMCNIMQCPKCSIWWVTSKRHFICFFKDSLRKHFSKLVLKSLQSQRQLSFLKVSHGMRMMLHF